jgi:hypothetical protein
MQLAEKLDWKELMVKLNKSKYRMQRGNANSSH